MAAREIVISDINKVHSHICHVSAKETIALIRDAKARGVNVTCETCPHYYAFTVEEALESGANAKMNPPLREKEDVKAVIRGPSRWNNRLYNNRPRTT